MPKTLWKIPILLFCGLLPVPAQAADIPFANALLWQVSHSSRAPSYVFGTIHSDDPRVMQLPAEVEQAFAQCQSLSIEVLMNMDSILAMQSLMYYQDGTRLSDVLGSTLYRKTVQALAKKGLPEAAMTNFKPWAVAFTLMKPNNSSPLFLDVALQSVAERSNMAVFGLETVAEQLGIFDGLSRNQQIELLKVSIDKSSAVDAMHKQMIELYLQRDLVQLMRVGLQDLHSTGGQLSGHLEQELIDKRNQRMVTRMLPRLEQGAAFIAVGALHLPGKVGILQLLVERGYRVTAVY